MKQKQIAILGALAIIFASSLWGLDGIILRPNLYHLDVSVVVFLEHMIAFLLMSVFLIREIKELKKLEKSDWISFGLIALFGGAIGTMAITKAFFLVEFNHLSGIVILQKLQPLFALIMAGIILKERLSKTFYTWAGFAVIGSYLIVFGFDKPDFTANKFLIASLFSLLAAFSWGTSTVLGKKVVNRVNFRITSFIRFGLTSLIMLIIITGLNKFSGFSDVTRSNLLILIIIAVTTGSGAIFIYYWGLRKVPASKATIYELGFPISAVIFDYLIHRSIMSGGQFLGAGFIIFSMIMIVRDKSQK